jgi:vancomycin resistance protein YoaR
MKFFIFLPIILFILAGCSDKTNTANEENINSTVQIDRTSTQQNTTTINKEEELAAFSTTLLIKTRERTHNIQITCEKLNGTVVNSGETFSFTETVGKATPDKGYEEADIFDSNGNIIKGYGGGNCQISSTLYNAVLAIPSLEVVERSPHSRKVDYVEERQRCCCCIWQC